MATSAGLVLALQASAQADPDGVARELSADMDEVRSADDGPGGEPTGRFEVGAGYATDDGFLVGAGVSQANLFGSGMELALAARLSQRRQLFLVHFADPHVGDGPVRADVDLFSQETEWPGFTRRGAGGALTLSRALGEHVRMFASYRIEDVSVELDAAPGDAPRLIEPGEFSPALLARGGLIASARAGLTYADVDHLMFPRRGVEAGAWIEKADPVLGSEVELTRGRVWLSGHHPLGPFTLHLSGALEGVVSNDPRGVPLSERLQLDGSSELRGFAPGGLGGLDVRTGVALGGNVKANARAELEFPVAPAIGLYGSVFADGGLVADLERRTPRGDGTVDHGAALGGGLTWRSPIGPIGAYVAVPVSVDGTAEAPVFIIGIGGRF